MTFQVTLEDEDGGQRVIEVNADSYEQMMERALLELDESAGEYVAGYLAV